MAASTGRVVGRVQRWLQGAGPVGPAWRPGPPEVAELEARVHRLRAMDVRFVHARLSPDVANVIATKVPGRVGGHYVATEV